MAGGIGFLICVHSVLHQGPIDAVEGCGEGKPKKQVHILQVCPELGILIKPGSGVERTFPDHRTGGDNSGEAKN